MIPLPPIYMSVEKYLFSQGCFSYVNCFADEVLEFKCSAVGQLHLVFCTRGSGIQTVKLTDERNV